MLVELSGGWRLFKPSKEELSASDKGPGPEEIILPNISLTFMSTPAVASIWL